MLVGLAILFATDGLLTLAGIWMMRSRRFGDSPPLSLVMLATLMAFMAHTFGYMLCQTVLVALGEASGDISTRMSLFMVNALSGALPAVVYGYAIVLSTANSVSMQFAMSDKKPDPLSQDAFKRARTLAQREDYVAAFEECRRLAAEFPDSPLPLIETALLQEKAGRYEDAANSLRRVMRQFAHLHDARRRASFLLAELLERRLDDPETADYLRDRMRAEAEIPDPAAAQGDRPAAYWIEMERARRMAERGEVDKAVARFRETFHHDPERPRPLLEAATLLERTARYDESADILRELARTSKPGNEIWAEAMYRLGRLLHLHLDDPDGGLHVLREVARHAPASKAAALSRQLLRDLSTGPSPEA